MGDLLSTVNLLKVQDKDLLGEKKEMMGMWSGLVVE
jgi:hypothetical protein